jgi:hypothetical protein
MARIQPRTVLDVGLLVLAGMLRRRLRARVNGNAE